MPAWCGASEPSVVDPVRVPGAGRALAVDPVEPAAGELDVPVVPPRRIVGPPLLFELPRGRRRPSPALRRAGAWLPPRRGGGADLHRRHLGVPRRAAVSTSISTGGRSTRTARRPRPARGSRRVSGGGGGEKSTRAKRSGRWPSTGRGEPTRSGPSRAKRRARVVASLSGDRAAGPYIVSCASRGRSGWATKEKPATGAPGGRASSSRRTRVSRVLTSRVGAGRSIDRDWWPSGSSRSSRPRRMQAKPRDSRRWQRRSRAARPTNRKGSRRDQRPLEAHPLVEGGRRLARHQGPGIDSAGRRVQLAAEPSQPARHPRRRQAGEVAHRAHAPALEGLGHVHLGRQALEGQGSEEGGLLARGHDHRRLGQAGGHPRRQLARRDSHPRRQAGRLGGVHQRAPQLQLGRGAGVVALDAVDVEIGDALAGVLDPRRERLGHLEQRLLRGPLALAVARPGHQLGAERPGLGEGEAGPHAGGPGEAGGGHHPGGVAVALHHHEGLRVSSGSLRSRAARGKSGRRRQAMRGEGIRRSTAWVSPRRPGAGRRPPWRAVSASPAGAAAAGAAGGASAAGRGTIAVARVSSSACPGRRPRHFSSSRREAAPASSQGRAGAAMPRGARAAGLQHRGGGGAAHPVGGAHQQRRVVGAGGPGQPQPGGLDPPAAAHRRDAEVEGHQGEAAVDQHLGGRQGVLEPGRTRPEEALEVDPRAERRVGVEPVSQVHQGRRRAHAGGRGEHRRGGVEKRPLVREPTSSTSCPRGRPPSSRRSMAGTAVANAPSPAASRSSRSSSRALRIRDRRASGSDDRRRARAAGARDPDLAVVLRMSGSAIVVSRDGQYKA